MSRGWDDDRGDARSDLRGRGVVRPEEARNPDQRSSDLPDGRFSLPSGLERQSITGRERSYHLRDSERHTLETLATFQVVFDRDLRDGRYGGDDERLDDDLRSLTHQGLVESRTVTADHHGRSMRVLALSDDGRDLLQDHRQSAGFLSRGSEVRVHSGFGKRSDLIHNASLYRMYQVEAAALERRGATIRSVTLERIATLKDTHELGALLAQLQRAGTHIAPFGFGASQDFADSTQVIAVASAGGLGLADRDQYVKDDDKSKELRAKYEAHVARSLELLGDAPADAAAGAKTVMAIETELAKASLTRVEQRNPHNLDHKMARGKFAKLAPAFDWDAYFAGLDLGATASLNVTEPKFYERLGALMRERSLAEWRTYLRWHTVRESSPLLARPFQQASFEFYGKALRGQQELAPRWKRCVDRVDLNLGEALGQVFVAKTFTADTKRRTVEMANLVSDAMQSEINQLQWMGPATKKRALEKLHAIVQKIGYPDKWRDYSSLEVKRDDFFGNAVRGSAFETHRQLAKIGKPLDRGEWGMTPPTVNAYYDPQMNDINFPAGVLQPPLFDAKTDDAPNYGNTGATIAHELTHGFDDEGRMFDAKGNLKDWWTKADAKAFEERTHCLVDQYAQYVVIDDITINSKLSVGEDAADLGGTWLAYLAWKAATKGQDLKPIDGMTPDQRYFVGMAQWACNNERPENLRLRALTDPHSPNRYRINGVVANMPEFAHAFGCKPGAPLGRAKPCRIW